MLAGVSRAHLFETLRAAGEPVSAADLADRIGLHLNTVRWHLDQLVEAGWATRETEARDRPGRPRLLYSALPGPESAGTHRPDQGYQLLAEILAGYLASTADDPAVAAEDAGRAWGRYLIDKPAPFAHLTPADVTDRLVRLFADLGFEPAPSATGEQIVLHACPFREVATAHPEVVCSVHLGMMQGALVELGMPERAGRLEPLVTPCSCHVELTGLTDAQQTAGAPRERAATTRGRSARRSADSGGTA